MTGDQSWGLDLVVLVSSGLETTKHGLGLDLGLGTPGLDLGLDLGTE